MEDLADELSKLNIRFHLLFGKGEVKLIQFIKKYKIGGIILDLNPLREPLDWAVKLSEKLNDIVPVYQVHIC